jgi:hypothetical protein
MGTADAEAEERSLAISPLTRTQLGLVKLQGRSLIEQMAEEAERRGRDE